MNNTVFIFVAVLLVSLALPFVVRWTRERYGVSKEDLKMASDILNISIMILEELDFKKNDDVVEFANIVRTSIEFAAVLEENSDIPTIRQIAYNHSVRQLEQMDVELTERRINIINSLIDMSLKFYV